MEGIAVTDVMLQELMSGNKDLDQQVRIIIFSNEFCSNSGIYH